MWRNRRPIWTRPTSYSTVVPDQASESTSESDPPAQTTPQPNETTIPTPTPTPPGSLDATTSNEPTNSITPAPVLIPTTSSQERDITTLTSTSDQISAPTSTTSVAPGTDPPVVAPISGNSSFLQNRGAAIALFTSIGLAVLASVILVTWLRLRRRRKHKRRRSAIYNGPAGTTQDDLCSECSDEARSDIASLGSSLRQALPHTVRPTSYREESSPNSASFLLLNGSKLDFIPSTPAITKLETTTAQTIATERMVLNSRGGQNTGSAQMSEKSTSGVPPLIFANRHSITSVWSLTDTPPSYSPRASPPSN